MCSYYNIMNYMENQVIVDEAHGAHLAFSDRLPDCAMKSGADIAVQSAHKTLPALTQGSYLHIGKGQRIDRERLSYCLNLLQTISPSYVIMVSLDIAAAIMAEKGGVLLDRLLDRICSIKGCVIGSGIRTIDCMQLPVYAFDETRIVFSTQEIGIPGFEAEKILRDRKSTR